jgi:hypothetical protein
MAGLRLNGTPTVLKNQDANVEVEVTPDGFAWEDYSMEVGDSWFIFGPNTQGGLALSGDELELENKTFTPKRIGRYLVELNATHVETGTKVRLSALYEVDTPSMSQSIPAAQEEDEYTAGYGWALSVEDYLRIIPKLLGKHELVAVQNGNGGIITKGSVLTVNELSRWANVGTAGDKASDYIEECQLVGLPVNATQAVACHRDLLVALDDIPVNGKGLCLAKGALPFDTAGWTTVDSPVYIQDDGKLGPAPGTHVRRVGVVRVVGGDDDIAAATIGSLFFDGTPPQHIYTDGFVEVDNAASPYSVVLGVKLVAVDSTAGVVTVNLPSIATFGPGQEVQVKDAGGVAQTNNITLAPSTGSETIDGAANYTLNTNNGWVTLRSSRTKWLITSQTPSAGVVSPPSNAYEVFKVLPALGPPSRSFTLAALPAGIVIPTFNGQTLPTDLVVVIGNVATIDATVPLIVNDEIGFMYEVG